MENRLLKRLSMGQRGEVVYKRPRTSPDLIRRQHAPSAPRAIATHVSRPHKLLLQRIESAGTILSVERETFSFRLHGVPPLPKLPHGYYFKGGAARETLRGALVPNRRQMHLRDYDVVRFSGTDDRHDHELAKRFMAADYEFGHGVEVAECKPIYFRTRDLRINEVLYRDGELECTYGAAADAVSGTLRATPYILTTAAHLRARTYMKALRLSAEGLVLDMSLSLADFPAEICASSFDVALHLNRALSAGVAIAEEYVLSAWKHGCLLPEREAPPTLAETIVHLSSSLSRGIRFFSNIPKRPPGPA